MTRADDDTWDISQSVGATALGCAEWRAKEAEQELPLFTDPYAHLFLDQVIARGGSSVIHSNLFPWLLENHPHVLRQVLAQASFIGSRTRWLDEFFAASNGVVTQAVILAAGLDTRAWRLEWDSVEAVYEIDQPEVLAFKQETLRSHAVKPAARYVPVGIDLRQDWPNALRAAGFKPEQPTAWAAEGLLPYLSAVGQDSFFQEIHGLSARGSRIAVDAVTAAFYQPANAARVKAFYDELRQVVIEGGDAMPEFPGLWYDEERADLTNWLERHGWQVDAVDVRQVMAHYQREVPEEDAVSIPLCEFIAARLPT